MQPSTFENMSGGTGLPILLAMLRRRAGVLVLGLLLGVVLALLVGTGQDRYRGQASLIIAAPSTGFSDADSLERNLNSEIAVLRSRETASAVAELVGGDTTAQDVLAATTIDAVAGSDLVQIQTTADSPAQAEDIAAGYVTAYLDASADRSRALVEPELERLDTRLAAISAEIADTNQQLQAALEPFLRRSATPGANVPGPGTVAPEAAARQQQLLTEYDRLLGQRQELEQEQQLQNRSTVLQGATVEDEPVGPDRRLQLLIVLVSGLVSLGVALALDAASGRIVSDQELERALGAPIAARLGSQRRLRRSSVLLRQTGWQATEDERLLWLRAERLCPSNGTALIVVTGASTSTGATTVAQVLALQFADSGHSTVVVDAVGGQDALTDRVGDQGDGGFAALRADSSKPYAALTPVRENLHLLGGGPDLVTPSRAALTQAVEALSTQTEIIVVDAPPALGSAVGIVQDAHVVVVAIDPRRAKVRQMNEFGLVLSGLRERLLPVLTPSRTQRRRWFARQSPGRPADPASTAK